MSPSLSRLCAACGANETPTGERYCGAVECVAARESARTRYVYAREVRLLRERRVAGISTRTAGRIALVALLVVLAVFVALEHIAPEIARRLP